MPPHRTACRVCHSLQDLLQPRKVKALDASQSFCWRACLQVVPRNSQWRLVHPEPQSPWKRFRIWHEVWVQKIRQTNINPFRPQPWGILSGLWFWIIGVNKVWLTCLQVSRIWCPLGSVLDHWISGWVVDSALNPSWPASDPYSVSGHSDPGPT